MAEQLLDGVDIVRVLQQVGGERMPKCVAERANETVGKGPVSQEVRGRIWRPFCVTHCRQCLSRSPGKSASVGAVRN